MIFYYIAKCLIIDDMSLPSFFNRLYCNQYLDIFKDIAYTITQEYIEDAYLLMDTSATTPNLKYFIEKAESLTNELTLRARWMSSEYKEGRGGKGSVTLTTSFKRVIKRNVSEYLHVVNTLKKMSANDAANSC
jgi:hypothetical protein